MRLRNRFLLIGLGLFIFFITAPVLVLFARGFMFDFEKRQIVKTGTLVVVSKPDDAQISLDEKSDKYKTPATIRFLLPQDYTITIKKRNYQPWTKRLAVKPQLVTWANSNREFIAMFLSKPKLLEELEKNNVNMEKINRLNTVKPLETITAGNYKFVKSGSAIFKENEILEKIYEPAKFAYWDKESRKLVISNDNEILLFDPQAAGPDLVLRSISPVEDVKLNWHTGYVFFQNEDKIKAVEADGRDHRNIYTITDAGIDYALDDKGERLYVIGDKVVKIYQIR